MSMNKLHWGQALQGRLGDKQALWDGVASQAGQYAPRLAKELAAGTLPFINMPYLTALKTELPKVMAKFGIGPDGELKHLLLLGIGGSALGPRALQKAFMPQQDWPGYDASGPHLWIADNVDAASLDAWLDKLPPKETLVVVISKSGGTIETMAQYLLVREWLCRALGEDWTKHVLAITDEKQGALRQECDEKGLASLPVPDHLGGRYSVLSAVGMVPAYFCGMDWKALLAGAAAVTAPLAANPQSLGNHPAWRLACWAKALLDANYSQLIFFSYIPAWACFGSWFCQLWAESLGKAGQGSMPLPAVGVTDQHSLLQMFLDGPKDKGCLFLESGGLPLGRAFGMDAVNPLPKQWAYLMGQRFGHLLAAEGVGTLGAMAAQQVPLVRLNMEKTDEAAAGSLIALLEMATVFTGWLLGIDPLDQPAVEYGKRLANARLGAPGYAEEQAALDKYFALPDEEQVF
ncbi:MAG: glucose-6-phosphate isomerase [Deltaproteobacteria bacterium]|jgi:glucose-6-phosphate isomerase|nr:glucose-6-phosphate isomerase [Deltaproteobacteria bacterium]